MQRITGKNVAALALIAFLAIVYIIGPSPDFIMRSGVSSCFLHHFFHANLLHLITNCYAIWVLFGRRFSAVELVVCYLIASLSWLCSATPSIGFSNVLFAIMGFRSPSLKSSWWRSPTTIVFLVVMLGYLFIPKVSAVTHIVAFVLGAVLSGIVRVFKTNQKDYGKAKGKL